MARSFVDIRVKALFFDRPAVTRAVDKARVQALSAAGRLVMRDARRSIRKARRKRLADLTPEELAAYEAANLRDRERARKAAKTRARRGVSRRPGSKRKRSKRNKNLPTVASRPGQPPRSRTGLLKRYLLYSYDRATDSVVVGPAKIAIGDDAPPTLEYGGYTKTPAKRRARVAPRPYMQPALDRTRPQLPELWRNSVRA